MTTKSEKLAHEQFYVDKRAFPFTDGEVKPGITVDEKGVRFDLQRGPVKEFGRNGCDLVDVVQFVRETLLTFNAKASCRENAVAITKLQEAEMWLRERTREREERGVEGTSAR